MIEQYSVESLICDGAYTKGLHEEKIHNVQKTLQFWVVYTYTIIFN